MKLKEFTWTGNCYELSIRRHWNTFFLKAVVFKIREPRMEKLLPESAGFHILPIYEQCSAAQDFFDTTDDWWAFSKLLCDHYCEHFVLRRLVVDNPFSSDSYQYRNDQAAIENFAKNSKGFLGPEKWYS